MNLRPNGTHANLPQGRTSRPDVASKRDLGGSIFLYAGLILLSGILQRVTSGELQGDFLLAEASSSRNYYMVLIGIAFYGWCLVKLIQLKGRLKLTTLHWPLISLVSLSVLSVLWSGSPFATLIKSVGLIGTTVFAVVAVTNYGVDRVMRSLVVFFCAWIIASGLIAVVARGYSFHSASDYYAIHAGLYKGFYYHKNAFALVASIAMVIIPLAPKGIGVSRRLTYVCFYVCLILILMSGSAKTAFSVPAGLVLAWALPRISYAARLFLAFSVMVFAPLIQATDAISFISEQALALVGRDPTLTARTDIWGTVISFTHENSPFLGGGYGGGAWQKGLGDAVIANVGSDTGHAHNGFLQAYAELGAVGLAIVACFFWAVISKLIKLSPGSHQYLGIATGVITVVIVNNTAGSSLIESNGIYWFMLCMTPYLCAKRRDDEQT